MKVALAALERLGTQRDREGMARYGIVAQRVFGVSVREVRALARVLGRDHALAQALRRTGWFEARLLAAFVEEPERLTRAEMDAWAHAFENWADCDTTVMHCFDRSPHAWAMMAKWVRAKEEFVKRAGFAMLASMALHHKEAPSASFITALALVTKGARDDRHFVKKAVNWALRSIGSRDAACHAASLTCASTLAESDAAHTRWIGKDAARQLRSPATRTRVARGERRHARSPARSSRR